MSRIIWGWCTMLNLSKCSPLLIRSRDNIINYADLLVKRIDMTPFGRPQVVHFGEADKAGYTLTQLIETSNITAHFAESSNSAYIDIFSCKPYCKKTVEQITKEFFQPQHIEVKYVERGYLQ